MRAAQPGLILAGGRASRLGGGDKMLRLIGGRSILSRIVDRLAPQCGELLLGVNGSPERLPAWSGPLLSDHPDDAGLGPLAGLLAGLDWVATHRPQVDALLTVPSDTPFLPLDLVARLEAARPVDPSGVAFARSAGRDHPLAALWAISLRHPLRRALRAEGLRRVRDLHERFAAVPVEWAPAAVDPFFNVNTPEDAALAERLANRDLTGSTLPIP